MPKLGDTGRLRDLGLLVIRVIIGFSVAKFHGWGKISGGPDRWEGIGGSMANLGITFLPVFWGFMAAFAEFFCSIFIIIGLFTRPAAALLACTMLVAMIRHLTLPPEANNAGWSGASHAMELFAVAIGLMLTGPGRFAMMRKL